MEAPGRQNVLDTCQSVVIIGLRCGWYWHSPTSLMAFYKDTAVFINIIGRDHQEKVVSTVCQRCHWTIISTSTYISREFQVVPSAKKKSKFSNYSYYSLMTCYVDLPLPLTCLSLRQQSSSRTHTHLLPTSDSNYVWLQCKSNWLHEFAGSKVKSEEGELFHLRNSRTVVPK
jgi:hypothetical protein